MSEKNWKPYISRLRQDPSDAEALDAILEQAGTKLERCIAIAVDEEALVARLLLRAEIEGRTDDNEAAIRNRMRVYREQTEPLLAYYRERGVLAEVNGEGGIEENGIDEFLMQSLDERGKRTNPTCSLQGSFFYLIIRNHLGEESRI